ncbi:putative ferric-chelate reductase 1 [Antedon mediterranea]|uniref:putative ferric-chelate reductase 1 n=1 Tax=Antedon mediterranea TaxID=105859 RepID=UPI003AF40B6E
MTTKHTQLLTMSQDNMLFKLAVWLSLICLASGTSNGALVGACVDLTPQHGVIPQTSTSPWNVLASSTTYTPGQEMTVTIQATGSQQYKGILLQARTVSSTTPVGTWTTDVTNTRQMTCSNTADGITHSFSTAKPLNTSFTWLPPSTSVGTIQFHATFVESYSVYWVDTTSENVTDYLCVNVMCLNEAVCIGGACNCDGTGYTGSTCQTQINECASNPCLNEGVCVDETNRFTCVCPSGYSGDRCESQSNTNVCASMPCLNGGICINETNEFTCVCPSGYSGNRCESE